MPVLESLYRPRALLRSGHLQTILPVLWPRRFSLRFERERHELDDGDFLDLDWLRSGRERLAILSHGLEGSTEGIYIRGMATALAAAGWDVLAWNFRGCSGEANRLLRSYHSGETGDLRRVIEHAGRSFSTILLVGFSLGGNMTLKYLGEPALPSGIVAAAAISVPVDLASSARALDERWENRVYLRRFLKALIAKIEDKARRLPGQLDIAGIRAIRSFREFDDRYTAPIHGFRDAEEYWRLSSSRPYLTRIKVPTLLLNARNDPFLDAASFPFAEAEQNPHFFLEAPESGGHVGFLERFPGRSPWSEQRVLQFLAEQFGGAKEIMTST